MLFLLKKPEGNINKNGKEYLIPVIDDVVIKVDIDENKVVIRPLKGIFED